MANSPHLQAAIAAGLIDPDRHSALLRNAARFVKEANIPLAMLYTSMMDLCSTTESEFMDEFMQHAAKGVAGLVLHGKHPKVSISDRFAVMAAVCLRNYLSARVMFLQDVFDALKADDMPQPTLLLVPDFHLAGSVASKVQPWQAARVGNMLYTRHASNLQTVLYVQDWDTLEAAYGPVCYQHIEQHFVKGEA